MRRLTIPSQFLMELPRSEMRVSESAWSRSPAADYVEDDHLHDDSDLGDGVDTEHEPGETGDNHPEDAHEAGGSLARENIVFDDEHSQDEPARGEAAGLRLTTGAQLAAGQQLAGRKAAGRAERAAGSVSSGHAGHAP